MQVDATKQRPTQPLHISVHMTDGFADFVVDKIYHRSDAAAAARSTVARDTAADADYQSVVSSSVARTVH